MEKLLRPDVFDKEPNTASCNKEWCHWKLKLEKCINRVKDVTDEDKLDLLITFVSSNVYSYIEDATSYAAAIETLDKVYNPKKNIIFARHQLRSCQQENGQGIDAYFQKLKSLVRDCEFKAVDKVTHENEAIRDAFIQGISSSDIRQRLLESVNTDVTSIYNLARSLEVAKTQADSYKLSMSMNAMNIQQSSQPPDHERQRTAAATQDDTWKCYFCGGAKRHSRRDCPAKHEICEACERKGHMAEVCRNPNPNYSKKPKGNKKQLSSMHYLAASPPSLSKSTHKVLVNEIQLDGLTDTGSSSSFLDYDVVQKNGWFINTKGSSSPICLASSSHVSQSIGSCKVDMKFSNKHFCNKSFTVVKNLCADVIIGLDILGEFSSVTLDMGGNKDPLTVCSMNVIPPASLFGNLDPSCKPIRIKSRRYSQADKQFIRNEVEKLHSNHRIEECHSPWRSQILVVKGDENHRDRFVVDYSQTINRFTKLDAYPVPRIDEMVEELSQYKYFSTLDLSSAFHQVPIPEQERKYTAFEACGKLWQYRFIPYGVTNGLSAFQRTIDDIVDKEKLEATFVFVDNITIAGKSKAEHDQNLAAFMSTAARYNLEFNNSKTVLCVESLKLLGYLVSYGSIQPDPDRVAALLEIPVPDTEKSLNSVLGLFAHHSKWVKNFSEKIHPLSHAKSFPLNDAAKESFSLMKKEIASAILATPDLGKPFTIETDASDYAIGATLSQSDQPIAFFSRTLNKSEKGHHSVEKEAYAIVESMRKWKHYLLGSNVTVITDQRSVAFMFDQTNHGKIKNDKIARWRIELSAYHFDTVHRPGKFNGSADAFSRIRALHKHSSAMACSALIDLKTLHDQLCHPGISRLNHFVRSKNLPYSVEDVKKVTQNCPDCAIIKPRFHKPREPQHLIKALAPFERLNMDFKGPLPSDGKNKYLLTIVDEYSRYPFAFPVADTSTKSVRKCLLTIFGLFGMPSYVHSDNGSGFISQELKSFLLERGVATSRSTRYNPPGNGQIEKYNGTIWKAIQLALKTQKLPSTHWEYVLTDALHSVRSLLCTATNETPHERMFKFPRKSTNGNSVPSWLIHDRKALMKRHVRHSKYEPLVEEVDVLDVNPQTSHIRTSDGREMTVSNRHLAPMGNVPLQTQSPGKILHSGDHILPTQADTLGNTNDPLSIGNEIFETQSEEIADSDNSTDNIDNTSESDENSSDAENADINNDFVRRSSRVSKQTKFFGC